VTARTTATSTVAAAAQNLVVRFTTEQVQRILSLIQAPKEGYENFSRNVMWFFDTGASCHMTGVYEVLENVRSIDSIVGLLDGN